MVNNTPRMTPAPISFEEMVREAVKHGQWDNDENGQVILYTNYREVGPNRYVEMTSDR